MQVLSLGLPTAVVGDETSKCLLTYRSYCFLVHRCIYWTYVQDEVWVVQ